MDCLKLTYHEKLTTIRNCTSSYLIVSKEPQGFFSFNRKKIDVCVYRYGFNGMEKDNEVYGTQGASYTTDFRQLDPRLGRWLSVDPKANELSWQSPYTSMDNNPIWFNDHMGDKWKDPIKDKAKADDLTSKLKTRRDWLSNKSNALFDKAQKKLDKGKYKSAETLADMAVEYRLGAIELGKSIDEIKLLDESDSYFTFEESKNSNYSEVYSKNELIENKNEIVTVIEYSSDANAIHELTHAYQSLIGDVEYVPNTRKGLYIDLQDEVFAYRRQYFFNSSSVTNIMSSSRIQKTIDITAEWFLNIQINEYNSSGQHINTEYPYKEHNNNSNLVRGLFINGFTPQNKP